MMIEALQPRRQQCFCSFLFHTYAPPLFLPQFDFDFQSPPEEVNAALDAALERGYRHIDTAYMYQNEAAIGETLKKWFDSGKLKREDIFIVTKVDDTEKYTCNICNNLSAYLSL